VTSSEVRTPNPQVARVDNRLACPNPDAEKEPSAASHQETMWVVGQASVSQSTSDINRTGWSTSMVQLSEGHFVEIAYP